MVGRSASSITVSTSNAKPKNFTKNQKNINVQKVEKTKPVKPIIEKQKTDSNGGGGKTVPVETIETPKVKPKMFGEDYIEAPLPASNPWKKTNSSSVPTSVGFPAESDPTPLGTRNKEIKTVTKSIPVGE